VLEALNLLAFSGTTENAGGFLEEHPETTIVQMDTVIGRIGGKCLLTIHFVETSLALQTGLSACYLPRWHKISI
jgi:hypothetical protein